MAAHGFEIIRLSQARASKVTAGLPDRRYYHRDRRLAVWWEAKAPSGKQRPAQRDFQQLVESVGEVYVLGGVEVLADWMASQVRRGRCGAG